MDRYPVDHRYPKCFGPMKNNISLKYYSKLMKI